MAAARERELAPQVPDRAAWQADRRELRERAAELEARLSTLRREHLHNALERPAPYLLASLGEPPDRARARHTWRQAAQRIETYRFDHAITDTRAALGPQPAPSPAREHWQRAQHDLQRAQHDLRRHVTRDLGREL
jgi:hypothetical protein